jgi:ribosomal protein S18 acetylase RimI-like enzyme
VRMRPLGDVSSRELRPLLEEESDHWAGELLWDYRDVSAAVASGVERRALNGFVLQDGLRVAAYCYSMIDAGRAIVGSVFAAAGFRGQGLEEKLVEAVILDAQRHPNNERVECQTLFSTAPAADERFASAGFSSRVRHYLVRPLHEPVAVPPHPWALRPLRREDLPAAAQIIHQSHVGSLDAALNLTYATPSFCRGFVETLVLRAGCGRFDPDASFVAESRDGAVGVLLASHLSRTNGHICQVSVAPDAQGRGIGRALLGATLRSFREQGLRTASLSVTYENRTAYALYQALGFRLRKEFAAHAWVRPPARIPLPA